MSREANQHRPTGSPGKIGIMADSHGDPEAIAAATDFLKHSACRTFYHLGDVCDSNEWKTADDCVARVRQYGIITRIKKEIRFSPLAAGQAIDLAGQRPCIVTCGALTKGFVMIWNPGRGRLTCRTFR